MIDDPRIIKPKKTGKSDFYSWRLYLWVLRNPNKQDIYIGRCPIHGVVDETSPTYYIGRMMDGGFTGAKINQVIRPGKKSESYFYPSNTFYTEDWINKTNEFWQLYLIKGACHFSNFYHKWVEGSNSRTCENCGEKQIKKIITETREVWTEVRL